MRITLSSATLAEAARLNRIIGSLSQSKNSRNAAITQINRLSAKVGQPLRAN